MKGVTPIIATVLLLMMTVAAAGAAYLWMSTLQQRIQEEVATTSSTISGSSGLQVDIRFKVCNSTSDFVELVVENTGTSSISRGVVGLTLKDDSGVDLEFVENDTALSSDFNVNTFLTIGFDLQTDLVSGESYVLQLVMPGSVSTSAFCTAQP